MEGAKIGYFSGDVRNLGKDLKAFKPTAIPGKPEINLHINYYDEKKFLWKIFCFISKGTMIIAVMIKVVYNTYYLTLTQVANDYNTVQVPLEVNNKICHKHFFSIIKHTNNHL